MPTPLFGTDGIRALVGTEPLSENSLPVLGRAIGKWIAKTYGDDAQILIGYDTRESATTVKKALFEGLLNFPITLYDAGVIPTPAASIIIKQNPEISCAIIISASHNTYEYNGIKIIDTHEGKLTQEQEAVITNWYYELLSTRDNKYKKMGTIIPMPDARTIYVNKLLAPFTPNFLQNKRVVLDCAHGATAGIAQTVFEQCGAEVISLFDTPDGTNINKNCGSIHPEIIKQEVVNHNADVGFAFDGDGDRIVVVLKDGTLLDGDDILALLANQPPYANSSTLVGTIMSNEGLARWCAEHNKTFVRTAVGDKHVGRVMQKENLLLGGEPSGHIILNDHTIISDGIFCALRVAQALMSEQQHTKPYFAKMPAAHSTLKVAEKKELTKDPIKQIISNVEKELKTGRIVVRYSGTEPILRILVEAQTEEIAQKTAQKLAVQLEKELE